MDQDEMIALLMEARKRELIVFKGTLPFEATREANQRGWLRLGEILRDPLGHASFITVLGLTTEGYDQLERLQKEKESQLERLQREKENQRLSRRLLRWLQTGGRPLFGSVERILLILLCCDMILRWLVFFFKD